MPSSTTTNLTLRILAIVALTGVLLSPPGVFAADVVVPPTPGSNGWVAAAQAALDNGDTVVLEPGGYHFTWDWQSCILRGYVLHLSQPNTGIRGAGWEATTVSTSDVTCGTIFHVTAPNTTIRDLSDSS